MRRGIWEGRNRARLINIPRYSWWFVLLRWEPLFATLRHCIAILADDSSMAMVVQREWNTRTALVGGGGQTNRRQCDKIDLDTGWTVPDTPE